MSTGFGRRCGRSRGGPRNPADREAKTIAQSSGRSSPRPRPSRSPPSFRAAARRSCARRRRFSRRAVCSTGRDAADDHHSVLRISDERTEGGAWGRRSKRPMAPAAARWARGSRGAQTPCQPCVFNTGSRRRDLHPDGGWRGRFSTLRWASPAGGSPESTLQPPRALVQRHRPHSCQTALRFVCTNCPIPAYRP